MENKSNANGQNLSSSAQKDHAKKHGLLATINLCKEHTCESIQNKAIYAGNEHELHTLLKSVNVSEDMAQNVFKRKKGVNTAIEIFNQYGYSFPEA